MTTSRLLFFSAVTALVLLATRTEAAQSCRHTLVISEGTRLVTSSQRDLAWPLPTVSDMVVHKKRPTSFVARTRCARGKGAVRERRDPIRKSRFGRQRHMRIRARCQ